MGNADDIKRLIGQIRGLQKTFARLSNAFRDDELAENTPDDVMYSPEHWRRNTYRNALIKLRLIVEQNFNYVETFGVLAIARYLFELSVWLRLFQKDGAYCLVYFKELLQTNLRYRKDTLKHLEHEIELLEHFESKDIAAFGAWESGGEIAAASAHEVGEYFRKHSTKINAEVARHFSLYLEDALTNGFGFQAHLVKSQAIPPARRAIEDIERTLKEFDARVPREVRDLAQRRWEWKRMATLVDLLYEYDYIYTYSSKILHAVPLSITTDQKNLEPSELSMFLRYIHVKLIELADLAFRQPECRLRGVDI